MEEEAAEEEEQQHGGEDKREERRGREGEKRRYSTRGKQFTKDQHIYINTNVSECGRWRRKYKGRRKGRGSDKKANVERIE